MATSHRPPSATQDMLHPPHYRDRVRETIFKASDYASLFCNFEGGALITWRWGSIVATARALKRRSGPLRMMLSMERYLANAACGEDNAGQAMKVRTETLKHFDAAINDPFFWHYLVPCPVWCWGCSRGTLELWRGNLGLRFLRRERDQLETNWRLETGDT